MALKNMKKKAAAPAEEAPAKKKAAATPAAEGGAKSWYMEGDEGFDRKQQIDQIAQMRREKAIDRFYLKHKAKSSTDPNTGSKSHEARIVFLDSKPFFIREHGLKLENRWGNFFTCVADLGQHCAICETLGDRPTFTGYLTVIDTRRWTKKTPDKKTGATTSKAKRVLMPLKGVAIDKIKEILEENDNNLRGLVVDVSRLGDKDPNCGRDFAVKGRLSEAKLAAKFPEENMTKKYEYRTVLAPPTADELKAAGVHGGVVAGSDEDIAQDAAEDADAAALLDD